MGGREDSHVLRYQTSRMVVRCRLFMRSEAFLQPEGEDAVGCLSPNMREFLALQLLPLFLAS